MYEFFDHYITLQPYVSVPSRFIVDKNITFDEDLYELIGSYEMEEWHKMVGDPPYDNDESEYEEDELQRELRDHYNTMDDYYYEVHGKHRDH